MWAYVRVCGCACMFNTSAAGVIPVNALVLLPVLLINEKGNCYVWPSHRLPSLVATVTGGNDTFGWADVYFLLMWLFLLRRCMDAKGEQSHHGDEVMSLLCYKRRRRQQVNAGNKKKTIESLADSTRVPYSYSKHLYLDHWWLIYWIMDFCSPACHVICVKCVYNCNYSWQKAQTVTAC